MKEFIRRNTVLRTLLCKVWRVEKYVFEVYGRMLLFYIGVLGRKIHFPGYYGKYKKIKDLKDRYCGKRAFVIATGPSLKVTDLERLNGEITFAVNSIFKIFDKTQWRPTHYVIDDYFLYKEYLSHGINIEFDRFCKKESFVSHPFGKAIKKNMCAKKTVVIPFCYYDHWLTDSSKHYEYSDDLMYGIKDLYMVTISAINIAQYMGVKEIYLLGTDCDYSGTSKHLGDNEQNIDTLKTDYVSQEIKQKKTWKFIHSEMEKRGIKIYNATRGGKLEEFERVDFDSIVK